MTQEYLGQIEITNATKDFTLEGGGSGVVSVSLTAGTYYVEGIGGADTQLIEHMEDQIQASHANFSAATVTRAAAGAISLDFGAVTTEVVFTDTALGTLLGFSASTLTGDTGYVAENYPKACWYPSRALVELPVDLTVFWNSNSTSKVTISRDGSSYGMEGNLVYSGVFSYEALPKTDVISTSSTVWTNLQSFWTVVVHEVRPIRVIISSGTYAATSDYVTALMLPADADEEGEAITIGPFTKYVGRSVESYNGLWDVNFKLAKYITA